MNNMTTVYSSTDGLYDSTPLTADELCDQCRALVFTITETCNPIAKELLNFILWERLDQLYHQLNAPINDEMALGLAM